MQYGLFQRVRRGTKIVMAPDAQIEELRALLEKVIRLRCVRARDHAGPGAGTPWS
jgi:hypothetical protein